MISDGYGSMGHSGQLQNFAASGNDRSSGQGSARAKFTLVPKVSEALWERMREPKLRFGGGRVSMGTAIEAVARRKGDGVSPGRAFPKRCANFGNEVELPRSQIVHLCDRARAEALCLRAQPPRGSCPAEAAAHGTEVAAHGTSGGRSVGENSGGR